MDRCQFRNTNSDKIEKVVGYLETSYSQGVSPLQQMYIDRFNLIDLGNRDYCKIDDGHAIKDWRSKMIDSIFNLTLRNSFVMYQCTALVDFIGYRKELALALVCK